MKKTYLLVLILSFLFVGITAFSQICTISIGKISNAKPGDTLLVPVYVTGFKDIGSIGLMIPFDTNVVVNLPGDTSCIVNVNASVRAGIISYISHSDTIYDPIAGMIVVPAVLGIAYADYGSNGINIPDGKIFDLKVKYKGGATSICFDTLESSVSRLSTLTELKVSYYCGYVSSNISYCQAGFDIYNTDSVYTYNFIDYSTGYDITKWYWDFGDSLKSTEQNPEHTYAKPGNYNVCLTVESYSHDTLLCTNTHCENLNVPVYVTKPPYCKAYFDYVQITVNQLYYQFEDHSEYNEDSISYIWFFGDKTTSTDPYPTHYFPSYGKYNVCMKIITFNKGIEVCRDSICKEVDVELIISCYVGIGGMSFKDSMAYPNDSLGFYKFKSILGSGYDNKTVNVLWKFGDNTSSTELNPVHSFPKTGNYHISLYATSEESGKTLCSDSAYENLNVIGQNDCKANFGVFYIDSIKGYWFYNFSTGREITNYLWNFGDNTESTLANPYHRFAKTADYDVCLTIQSLDSNSNTCTSMNCQNDIYYNFFPETGPPPPDKDSTGLSEPDLKCEAGFTFNFDSIQGKYYFYGLTKGDSITKLMWDFGDSTSGTGLNPTHIFNQNGNYNVCFTINSINKGNSPCSDTYCETMIVTSPAIFVKNNMMSDNIFSEIYPDPVSETANINLNLQNQTDALNLKIDVYNYLGQFISTANTNYSPGTHILSFSTTTLLKGMYFVRISGNNFTSVRSFVKL